MPFNGGIGMHDAKWRSSFGGTLYKTGGSHGCINLPHSVAKKIYENISAGMPVLCYNLEGTEKPSAPENRRRQNRPPRRLRRQNHPQRLLSRQNRRNRPRKRRQNRLRSRFSLQNRLRRLRLRSLRLPLLKARLVRPPREETAARPDRELKRHRDFAVGRMVPDRWMLKKNKRERKDFSQ